MIHYTTITFHSVNCLRYTKEFKTHSITLGHRTKAWKAVCQHRSLDAVFELWAIWKEKQSVSAVTVPMLQRSFHETLSYLVWIWCCPVCTLRCDNMAVQIQSLFGQYTFTGMADMYSIFSHAYSDEAAVHHIHQDPFLNQWIPDKKKKISISTSQKDKHLCSQQQNKEQEGLNLFPISGGKR